MSSLPGLKIPLFKIKVEEIGTIKDIKEIIVRIDGLPSCLKGQILDMGDGVKAMVMGFDEEDVHALVLGDPGKLRMGKEIKGISEPFKIGVGDALIGRMISALGMPLDQAGEVEVTEQLPVFRDSPPIVARAQIDQSMLTGTKIVDMLIPIAKGQRQLILGDRMTGKTSIGVDAILNQKGKDVVCIYCACGKSVSNLEKTVDALREADALDYTVLVVATDSSPVGEQYIVPYSAATVTDYFTSKGHDVLVVFDDLTKHAWAYRQLSLLLEMPPGREAYPGDIFYVQTMLMERAGRFNDEHGGGSSTFLGIAETLQGDLSGYIPSNLASMCDGQVIMSSSMFAEGFRPAIDPGLSLSIVGGRAQPKIIKNLSRTMRSDYAHFHEILKLSKLQSGLSDDAAKVVNKGMAIQAIFQQGERCPVLVDEQALLMFAVENGDIIGLDAKVQAKFCAEIGAFAREHASSVMAQIVEVPEMTPEIEQGLKDVITAYFVENPPEAIQSEPEPVEKEE